MSNYQYVVLYTYIVCRVINNTDEYRACIWTSREARPDKSGMSLHISPSWLYVFYYPKIMNLSYERLIYQK